MSEVCVTEPDASPVIESTRALMISNAAILGSVTVHCTTIPSCLDGQFQNFSTMVMVIKHLILSHIRALNFFFRCFFPLHADVTVLTDLGEWQ
jgi:hypothetical protein